MVLKQLQFAIRYHEFASCLLYGASANNKVTHRHRETTPAQEDMDDMFNFLAEVRTEEMIDYILMPCGYVYA